MNGSRMTIAIEAAGLIPAVEGYHTQGFRLVQICCVKEADRIGLHYTFDKDYDLVDLTCEIAPEAPVPSITALFPCAFLYENEIHDLFGIVFQGLNVDFKGLLYKVSTPRAFNPITPAAERQKD